MVGKNNHYLKDTKQGTRVESYSIKKFKVGAASVVIGASIFFGAGAAQASEEVSNNTTDNKTTDKSTADENTADTPKAVAKTAVENTKESVEAVVAAKTGAETTKETAKAEVKKDILKSSVESLEEKLKTAQDADKTAVETARKVLEEAKTTLANEAATQEDVNTQVVKVQALSTVLTEAKTQAFDKKIRREES